MNKSFNEFNWGQTNQEYINLFSTENFINRIYEKHYKIQKDDVIVDVGSNYGSFSLSIQDSQPNHIYCIEPSSTIFDVLKENLNHMPCTFINKAIGCDDDEKKLIGNENFIYHQNEPHFSTIKFKTFLETYNIKKIDFLKFDCEGGEFHIFNEENLDFIKNNVKNIAGEYHITYHSNSVENFINFRNNYLKDLKEFDKLYIYDRDDNNITENIFDDDYVRLFEQNSWNTNPYRGQFMIYANFEKNNLNQKLINFPPVYYISLKDSIDRQKVFEEQFTSNGITNVNMVEAYDGRKVNYTQENDVVSGLHFLQLDSGGIATTISHLKAISDWYKNSDSEYAIFFEDDMTIDSINDWNFTWDEFLSTLPKNWKSIQLSLIKDEITNNDMKLSPRFWWNWSAGSYLIKRNYAKELIDFYCSNEQYFLRVKDEDTTIPCVEHCLFSMAKENAYTIPLFYENINFVSTFYEHFIESTHKNFQVNSSNYVKNWWKLKSKNVFLNNLKLSQLTNKKMNHIYQKPEFGEEWFSFPNLYSKMVEKFPSGSKFVEVGSWKGKSSAYMAVEIANSNKEIDFYCVDTWKGSVEHQEYSELSELYNIFIDNMKSVEPYYFPLKITSLSAASKFRDKSLDFVFIDASHEYEDVKADILAWLPKVKVGGILAGHDYYVTGTDWHPGVKRAVNEILNDFETDENCFIYHKKKVLI